MLAGIDRVTVHNVRTNDVWIRDFGPTFVQRLSDGQIVGVDWHFNAWVANIRRSMMMQRLRKRFATSSAVRATNHG